MLHDFTQMVPVLNQVSIFGGLTEHELEDIYSRCDKAHYSKGECIIREGTAATEIFIILDGKVKVVLGIDENPFEIIDFGPGDCIGETSVIGVLNHSASVIALEDTNLLVFSRKLLTDLFHENKNLFSFILLNIARELARRLHHTDEILLQYGRKEKKDNKG